MKKAYLWIILLIPIFFVSCDWSTEKQNNIAAVSIAPLEGLFEEIAGDNFEVITMIPQGYSPTNYEASPKEIQKLSDSKVFFTIGVPAEEEIIKSAKDMNKELEIIDLGVNSGEKYGIRTFEEEEHEEQGEHEEGHEDHHHEGNDPHQWLSPKRVGIMLEDIKSVLIKIDGDNKEFYEANYNKAVKKIDDLHKKIEELVMNKENKTFLIYHPALGYLADDYGLDMIVIEESGKEATAKSMTNVIDLCKEKGIKVVFYQEEMDSRQAEIIAKEIDGEVYKINPLEKDYYKNIENIIKALDFALK